MKKITLLLIAMIFSSQAISAQKLTHSQSQDIVPDNSLACELTNAIIKDNIFYRNFKLVDFGITSSYDITSVEFGVEKLKNAPTGGYPVTVQIYNVSGGFPGGTLTLAKEETVNLTDQELTIVDVPITASISANGEFAVGISVPSDDVSDGGNGDVTFQIGSNKAGENAASYYYSVACTKSQIVTFASDGRTDLHVVMNVNGNSASASIDDLAAVGFNYYTNSNNELVMKANEAITDVSVYNFLGQRVRFAKPAQLKANMSLASLESGAYIVKATVNDKVGTFKILNQ